MSRTEVSRSRGITALTEIGTGDPIADPQEEERSGNAGWSAGTSRVIITPERPMWMTGFGMRTRATGEVLADIWAKALAIEDPSGRRAVVLSAELCGIPGELSENVAGALDERFGLPREAVMVTATHTHSGPVVEGYLEALSGTIQMSEDDEAAKKRYTRRLEERLIRIAGEALEDLEPVALAWGTGEATFAVNRRNNTVDEVRQRRTAGEPLTGPVDPTVPVLLATRPDGSPKAILTAYACHATVLSDYAFNGDWPGFAQEEIEKNFPGATALFIAGCAGDSDPIPGGSVELAEQYGRRMADAVKDTVEEGLRPVRGRLELRHDVLDLPFEDPPGIGHFREVVREYRRLQAEDPELTEVDGFQRALLLRAEVMVREYGDTGRIPEAYPYPIQIWNLGSDLTWVSLAGEVTSGYALRLREELGPHRTWVTAYAHDVMGYIPTRRIWEEGGYEGDSSHVYYALPARWNGKVEELIIEKVHRLASETGDRPEELAP